MFRSSVALLVSCLLLAGAMSDDGPQLKVDPLLLAQAEEVWQVIARKDNPVWPGWNASTTPLLFYFPNVQDVLVNHPKPPEGFRRYTGPVGMQGATIHVRDSKTFFDMDGQNTATTFAGVPTLVVADTLSNRRNNIRGMLEGTRQSGKVTDPTFEQLSEDPYGKLGMIAHEAFHVFQQQQAPKKMRGESELISYPTVSAQNALGFALEGDLLAEAIKQRKTPAFREAVVRWLAVRQERRSKLAASSVLYEDKIEYLEGLAKYVEYRLMEVLEGQQPRPAMYLLQGFQGYGHLAAERDKLVRQMTRHMKGEVIVNNDPYGTAPLRMRLYFSGMALGVLLDQLSTNWKEQIFAPERTLTDLIQSAVKPTEAELAAALSLVRARPNYATLAASKAEFEKSGLAAITKAVEEIEKGPKTTLVVDYSALEKEPGFSYTTFGLQRVDEHRTIYRLVPITVLWSSVTMRQTTPQPMLHDRSAKRLTCQLQEVMNDALVAALGANPATVQPLKLPGITLSKCKWEATLKDRQLVIRLLP
jgi:hypothetical protein